MMVRFRKTQALIMAIITFILTVTLYSSVEVNAVNISQSYTIFSAGGKYVDDYTLESNPIKDNSREIIGEDERCSHNALSGVVEIYTNYMRGTGFFIDDHTIATAAHVIFNKTTGDYTNSQVNILEIYVYNEDGDVAQTIRSAYHVHVPNNYIDNCNNGYESFSYDYALITLSEGFPQYANFNLGIPTDNIIDSSLPVYTTGFPSDKYGKQTCQGNVISFECSCDRDEEMDYERNLVFDMDVMDGQSGSPVYTYSKIGEMEYYTVIGIAGHGHTDYLRNENGNIVYDENGLAIVVGTANYGPRITTELLHFFKNNPNITWQGKSDSNE